MNRNPVLLIHGFLVKKSVFDRMYTYLTSKGWEVHRFDLLPSNGSRGIDKLALQVADYIEQHFPTSVTIDLVGLSMGGIVSRYYIQRLGGIDRIQRFITISSPHYGTLMAYSLPLISCRQMRPNSSFLKDLNRDVEVLQKLNFTSIWTPYDFIMIPPETSQLGIGKEVKIPVFTHKMMVIDKRSLQAVAEALSDSYVSKK
jgi:triacylglycerol lipase